MLDTVQRKPIDPELMAQEPLLQTDLDLEVVIQHNDLLRRLPNQTLNVARFTLVNLISNLENLIVDVLRIYYRLHPGLISRDKHFSYDDFLQLSPEDALNYAIDLKLQDFMHQSLKDWQLAFNKLFKVDLTAFSGSWEAVVEVYERRNIAVHNAGRINQIYLHKVPQSAPPPVPPGFMPVTDWAYLHRACDLYLQLGLYLINRVWAKLDPEHAQARLGGLHFLAHRAVEEQRWSDAALTFPLFRKDPALKAEPAKRVAAHLEYLLTEKRLRGLEAIRPDLYRFQHDHPDNTPRVAALISALSEDLDAFLALVDQAQFTPEELATQPFFEEFRADGRFTSLYEGFYPTVNIQIGAEEGEG